MIQDFFCYQLIVIFIDILNVDFHRRESNIFLIIQRD